MNNKLFVIIVTYNGAKWIEQCLNSVYSSTAETIPIVVDNNSTDNTPELVRRRFPGIWIIETGENLGFGRANNIGIIEAAKAGADYIYLLNQDAWVDDKVFETLIDTHKRNKEYGILSPLQVTGDGRQLDRSFHDNAVCESKCPGFLNDYERGAMKPLYQTTFVMAAHWLLYVPYLHDVGLFSPMFPHYGEDSNLCHRFIYWGYKIGIAPSVCGYHDRQYRVKTPQQKIYLNYITFLNRINNPLTTSHMHVLTSLGWLFMSNLKVKNVSNIVKVKSLRDAIKSISKSKYFLNTYKKIIPYEYFSED